MFYSRLGHRYKGTLFTYIDGVVGIFIVDESKAPRPSRLMIVDDLDLLDRSVLREHLPDLLLPCVQAQPKHTNNSTWTGVELRVKIKE